MRENQRGDATNSDDLSVTFTASARGREVVFCDGRDQGIESTGRHFMYRHVGAEQRLPSG